MTAHFFLSIKTMATVIVSLFLINQAPAQSFDNGSISQKIDSLFSEFDTVESPGYAIGILKDTVTIYKKGYGSANLDYQIPITEQSAFDIASVSKQFTAAGVALLILDGKLTLETPVQNFIPDLGTFKDTIRIKHLLYNSSGLTDYFRLPRPDGSSSWVDLYYFDIDEAIEASLSIDTLAFKPGSRWDYSNINFMLLTKVIEQVSGKMFSEFISESIFRPLGMNHTIVNDDVTEVVKNRVTPYNPRTAEYIEAYKKEGIFIKNRGEWIQHHRNSPHYGGSGIISTVEDLLKWSKNFFTNEFRGEEFYQLMHRRIKFDHLMDNQAMGLYFSKYKGRTYIAWEGATSGISTQLIRFPEQKLAIVVLSNLGSGEASKKAIEIADIMIEASEL